MSKISYSFLLMFSLGTLSLFAHPSVSLVEDAAGNLYYSDLFRVWRIDPQGQRKVVVDHVHTHELYLDEQGYLYGENLWYNGEALNTWGHFVWRLGPHGEFDTLSGPSPGFLEDYSFVRDDSGYMYWADRFQTTAIRRKLPDGPIQTLFEGNIPHVGWMNVTPGGVLYFVSGTDLCTLDADRRLKIISGDLAQFTVNHPLAALDTRNAVMGIWTWKTYVYAAITSTGMVKRWSPDSGLEAVYRSPKGWIPTGGHIDRKGKLWILECSDRNEMRIISPASFTTAGTGGSRLARPLNRSILLLILASALMATGTAIFYLNKRLSRNGRK